MQDVFKMSNYFKDNFIAYYKGLTQSFGGQFVEQEEIVWFSSGRRSLVRFNGVLRCTVSEEDLAVVAGPVLNHYFSNNLPFFWVDFPPGAIPGLGKFLHSRGVSLIATDAPGMQRSLNDLPSYELPDEVHITTVQSAQDQADWLEVHMRGFDEPEETRTDFQDYLSYTLSESRPSWRHFLARWGGVPCAISTLLCAPEAAGIYHVTTLPEYRGRGLGKALTLAAMQAGRELGYSTAVLFATQDGLPLYQKLGFATISTANLYAWMGQ